MKKNILSLLVILPLLSFLFIQCSNKQKEAEKKQQDSIALQNKITDSLKKIEEKVHIIGFTLLIMLMALIVFNDIRNF